ncbi:MAG: family 43 glycosylhydrolase [Clostridia bacterium]|nr:family 43 glycosylhydrolase [Clostridia bacterium]
MKHYCNPLNLSYRYQRHFCEGKFITCREAADPSAIFFRGKYYLFPSMTDGFFVSNDLATWEFRAFLGKMPTYDYAPDVCEVNGELVLCASALTENCNFYRTSDPETVPFEVIPGTFAFWDPHLYFEDGRLYLYWGCSNDHPIYGVELNPDTFAPMGEPKALIWGDPVRFGYERTDYDNNAPESCPPYIEGAWLNKYGGKYYLQYAAPGTQFNIYCDGVYVSDDPLGPYVPQKNNPFSLSPGGFVTGAGHGSTFEDREGRLWHMATTQISVNHPFERRLGLWRAGYDEDGELFCDQRFGDWPKRVDGECFADPDWMLLSYNKPVTAGGTCPEAVADENCRAWWTADPDEANPTLTLDLTKVCSVYAVQVHFADFGLSIAFGEDELAEKNPGGDRVFEYAPLRTRWLLEGSADGVNYFILSDKRQAETDLPGDTVFFDGEAVRYLRLTVTELPYRQTPKVSGLRVFGRSEGLAPQAVTASARRTGPCNMEVTWASDGAEGACILWGHAPDKLYHARTTFLPTQTIGSLMAGDPVYLRVDAFNSHGITRGQVFALEEK